ncbi:hypothetical protein I5R65_21695 [Herbaspirillum sp. AP02]|uniref:hypothetical protein n=1 Tax=unclassified Herbaspirillum TaxID=2624150 RepID=UPI0015DB4FEA|nr:MULTISPECIES: hypothetical protein [unclassified Herbaspirillum]MBG7622095.1 hypothetical protein [Herbaspirillum sp. AP02]NZD69114.1 hypothetical protein [Herbaspirillum sp. AP21]
MEHEFTLRFMLGPADAVGDVNDILERLGEAGCLDALVGIGAAGRIALDFSRSAASLEQAIRSAIADVKTAIPTAELYSVELEQGGENADAILKKKLADLLAEMPHGLPRVDGWDDMPSVGLESK